MKVAGKNIIQIGEYIIMWSRRYYNRNVKVDFTSWYIHLFGLYFFLLPSYCRILSIFTFILSFRKKLIPNTFLHNIWHGWFLMIYTYENLFVAYFSINGRFCLVSLKNPTFSNIFPRAKHVLMTFEFWTLCACLSIFSLYISHLLLSSQQSPIDIVNYFISKSWWWLL